MPSPYDILGVSYDTPIDEVKKKYRKLAKQYHQLSIPQPLVLEPLNNLQQLKLILQE